MADLGDLEGGAAGGGLRHVQRLVNFAAAATSLALVAGLGYWGYQLAVRDVTGIPVVRALDGPMRVAPSDPGGEIASHIGLSVNAIAAEGEEAEPADRLVLAPRPVDLAPEDLPATAPVAAPADAPAPEPNPSASLGVIDVSGRVAPVTPLVPVETPTETRPADPAAALVLAEGPLEDALEPEPMGDAEDLVAVAQVVTDGEGAPVIAGGEPVVVAMAEPEPAPPGALKRSLRPLARPSEMVVLAAASATAPAPTVAKSADPASIKAGTRLVQLGAFDDEADAIAEWNRLTAQFGSLMADKSRVLQSAQSSGRDFIRLRAVGFADEADARRFCSALLAENAACIPVAQR